MVPSADRLGCIDGNEGTRDYLGLFRLVQLYLKPPARWQCQLAADRSQVPVHELEVAYDSEVVPPHGTVPGDTTPLPRRDHATLQEEEVRFFRDKNHVDHCKVLYLVSTQITISFCVMEVFWRGHWVFDGIE